MQKQNLISHRGNQFGPNPEKENSEEYIHEACSAGFDVEVDVWYQDNKFYLGHDKPTYLVDIEFFYNNGLWCHAKNIAALSKLLRLITFGDTPDIHCFWHQEDDVTLTSRGYIWTYPGKEIASSHAIAVCPERVNGWDISKAYGICSDFVGEYKC